MMRSLPQPASCLSSRARASRRASVDPGFAPPAGAAEGGGLSTTANEAGTHAAAARAAASIDAVSRVTPTAKWPPAPAPAPVPAEENCRGCEGIPREAPNDDDEDEDEDVYAAAEDEAAE